VHYGLIETAKLNGLEAYKYLNSIFKTLPYRETVRILKRCYRGVLKQTFTIVKAVGSLSTYVAAANKMEHKQLNVSAGIRAIDKVFYIQNVNAYYQRLKSCIRRFHGAATKYLEHYLGWFKFSHKKSLMKTVSLKYSNT
jgi:hypothetical protein